MLFKNREDGAERLADLLAPYAGAAVVVYGLPRGGVVTAKAVADRLGAPLDLIVTRKIGHPNNPEYAIGAIAEDGQMAMNEDEAALVSSEWLVRERDFQLEEARRRRAKYLMGRDPVPVEGKTAILVDDGIATGYTMKAAILAVRARNPAQVIVAAPVAPLDTANRFRGLADQVVVCKMPPMFFAIGQFYEDFDQVTDDEVLAIMARVREPQSGNPEKVAAT